MTRLRVADDPRTAHVYYCYAADGALLYVGCALDINARIYMHLGYYGSDWMPRYCTRVVVTPELPMPEARQLEREEIRRLHPVFNKHHNRTPRSWAPVERPDGPSLRAPHIEWLDAPAAIPA